MSEIRKVKEQELKRVNLNIPVELHNQFKSLVSAEGQNITDVLTAYIRSYIEKHSPKGRRR